MDEKVSKKIEEMLLAQEGILSICSVKECGKILLGAAAIKDWNWPGLIFRRIMTI